MALQWAGWRAGGAVAALVHHRLRPLLVEHLLVVLGEDLGHVGHRPVAGLHGVPVEGAPQDVSLSGKHWSMMLRKVLAMLDFTIFEKGGLNQVMRRLRRLRLRLRGCKRDPL